MKSNSSPPLACSIIMKSSFSVSIIYSKAQICMLIKEEDVKWSTHFVKLDDVRVSNFLEDLDFPGDSFDVLLVIDFLFLKNFYGDLRQLLN